MVLGEDGERVFVRPMQQERNHLKNQKMLVMAKAYALRGKVEIEEWEKLMVQII